MSKMPKKVKAMLAAAAVIVFSMNIDAVQLKVMPLVAHHPKLSSWFTGIVFVVGLLQKPVVHDAINSVLDIEQTSPTSAVVSVSDAPKP